MTIMPSLKYSKPDNAGFSLIEIMVGMVIGLISMIIVMQVFSSFEGQKRTTTSGSDAQTNGGLALYTIERDVRAAGYGFADAIGCTVNTAQNTLINQNVLGKSFLLAPVTIIQGGAGLPDTIKVMASAKRNWSEAVKGSDHTLSNPALSFIVGSTLGIAPNDLLIAYEFVNVTLKPCTMFQVSNPDAGNNSVNNPILHTTGNWNQNLVFPNPDYTGDSMLLNMGSLMLHHYSLDAQSNLVIKEYDSVNNPGGPDAKDADQILFPDVVSLQAQYGFDARPAATIQFQCSSQPGQCSIVNAWSDTLITQDNIGGAITPGEAIARNYAIRFAVVARSGLKEKPDATTGACSTTSAANNNLPSWAGGIIDVSRNPDSSANTDWMCYRYKTFETVVPLRNPIWKQR